MGKVKTKRFKVHNRLKAQKAKQTADQSACASSSGAGVVSEQPFASAGLNNLFKKTKIDLKEIERHLNYDDDAQTNVTNKSLKGLNLKKKDKKQLRHHLWLQKIDNVKLSRKAETQRKKREQNPVTGDLQPLEDSLPTLELLMKSIQDKDSQQEKTAKAIPKEKTRQQREIQDRKVFAAVLEHPSFQENRLDAISRLLRQRVEDNQMQLD